MDAAKRFAADKAGKGFHAEGEFLLSQRMIALEGALFETLQMLRLEVLRAVDNAQMLTAAALHGGLQQPAVFDDHHRSAAYQAAEYADARALATAILHYGQAANNVFLGGRDDIAILESMNKPAVLSSSVTFNDGTGKVTGASFMALTKPEFRFYTANIDEQTAYAYNQAGITVEMANASQEQADALNARFVKKADGKVLLEVTGVLAENMDKVITVTINALGQTITFNGNAFAKAMANPNNDEAQQNLGAALYNYGAAAKTCFGA